MPIYDYKCQDCNHIFEKAYSLKDYAKSPQPICPECGRFRSKRHYATGHGGIQCDSINDVKWLPSALMTLQRDGERPIQSRTEWRQYCKDNHVACKG